MADNETPPVDEENPETDYIAAIQKLKNETVSKTDYDKLVQKNKELLQALIEGRQMEDPNETPADINALRKELFGEDSADLSNLEYVTKSLELRDALIKNGERDPFLPWGTHITPTNEDIEAANRAASIFQECIEYANGDSALFTAELQRRTVDARPGR